MAASPPSTVRVGTRASELALRQARLVQAALERLGVPSELKTFRTVGDKRLDEPLSRIGAKGLFTKELEDALLHGKVECCVHSLKDLPTASPDGLELVALLTREDPRDVVVLNEITEATGLEDLPRGSRVGTSSLRRRAQLRALRPDLEVVELRGNVPTRLRKVDEGQVHAAILAAAGLLRLGTPARISAFLEPPAWLPAPGQGAIAVQIRGDDARMRALLAPLNDEPTAVTTRAERALLARLEGGCQVPIGALARLLDGGVLELHGLVADTAGRRVIRGHRTGAAADAESLGTALGDELLTRGGGEILAQLRSRTEVPAPQPE